MKKTTKTRNWHPSLSRLRLDWIFAGAAALLGLVTLAPAGRSAPMVIQTEVTPVKPAESNSPKSTQTAPLVVGSGREAEQPPPPSPAAILPKKPVETMRPAGDGRPGSAATGSAPVKLGDRYARANLGLSYNAILGNQPISDIGTYGVWENSPRVGSSVLFGVAYGKVYNRFLNLEGDFRYRSSAEFRSVSTTPDTNKRVTTTMNLSFMTLMATGQLHLPQLDSVDYMPYLTVSGGFSIVDSSKPQIVTQTSSSSSSASGGEVPDGSLAWVWGVGAGLDYKLSEVISLNFDYRLTNLRFQLVPVQTKATLDIYTNDFSVGVKYRF
ncbi:MAG: outer membrane beta-barrel protein [Alphaproteobacteria bacterium]|nr:outer membrane beta-barrel protein [Alphaproteobacteria bacterium]